MPWHGTDAVDSDGRGPAVVPVLVRPVRCDADESFAAAAADVNSSPGKKAERTALARRGLKFFLGSGSV
jgi:hypothetical protein